MIPLCSILSLLDGCITQILKGLVNWVFNGIWDAFEYTLKFLMSKAVEFIVGTVGTIWVRVPTIPIVQDDVTFTPTDSVAFMQGKVMYLAFAAATISVIIAGMQMAFTHRGEALREVVKSLVTLLVATLFGVALVSMLVWIGDGMAQRFIDDVTSRGDFKARINEAVNGPFSQLTLPLMLLLGGAMICSSILQIGLMFVRNGMLVLLIGVLPLAAAATNTEMGKMWFRKIVGWLAAFIAYKPVAALIYAVAFRMFSSEMSGGAGVIRVATGVTLMVMAVVAMPALIRFVAPKGA
jgi:hypothetical protein